MREGKFEKFVTDHRDQFDDKVPSDGVWNRIAAALPGGKSVSLWDSVVLWRAAAIVMLGTSVFLFLNRHAQTMVKSPLAQQEFRDIESFYSAQISEKVALITDQGLFADDTFTQDLQKLEAMYTVLAEEMKKHPSEKVKDALVLNMLVRIDLLNQQIQKLEESKKKTKVPATI